MHHDLDKVDGKDEVKLQEFDPNISPQYESMLKCLQKECNCYKDNCKDCENFSLCKKKNINFMESKIVELVTEEFQTSGKFKLKQLKHFMNLERLSAPSAVGWR